MDIKSTHSFFTRHLQTIYEKAIDEFESSHEFKLLKSGDADRKFYDDFIVNLCYTHLNSTQYFAFIYSLAPLETEHKLRDNLAEEMGYIQGEESHPELLLKLLKEAGFPLEEINRIEREAHSERMRFWSEKFMLPSLREFGLLAHIEVGAFEWMLAALASRIASSLNMHRNVPKEGLKWFIHHSEVDALHAQEALHSTAAYALAYEFSEEEFKKICDITFRFNPFLKRYFKREFERTAQSDVLSIAQTNY